MDPTIIVVSLGLWLFAPKPKLFQPKPDMKAVAAAQAEADRAKADQAKAEAELAKLQAELQAKQLQEESKRKEILGYGQETNAMASEALDRVPQEHRTAEVELASEMVGRTGVAFTSILGQLRPDQREALYSMVSRLLSRQEEERKKAREELEAKDKELSEAVHARALVLQDLERAKSEVAKQQAEVLSTKAEVVSKDAELRNANEKALTLLQRINVDSGSFYRLIGYCLFAWLWFTRVLPALAKTFAWAKCLDGFNQFVFRLIIGNSNHKD